MKSSTKWFIGLLAVVVLAFFGFGMTGNGIDEGPHPLDNFAKCITESGARMYGAFWCPHCLNQKNEFESAFQYIDYVECAPQGNDADPKACEEAGVDTYPTWTFGNGERRTGEIPLRELAFRTGCELPEI